MKFAVPCFYLLFISIWVLICCCAVIEMRFFKKEKESEFRENPVENPFNFSTFGVEPFTPRPRLNGSGGDYVTHDMPENKENIPPTPTNSVAYSFSSEESLSDFFTEDFEAECKGSYNLEQKDFEKWARSTIRKMKMLHDLHLMQNSSQVRSQNVSDLVDSKVQIIQEIENTLNRLNAGSNSYFLFVFHLNRFLTNTPSSLLITSSEICLGLCNSLESFLKNPVFRVNNFERFRRFLNYYYAGGRHPRLEMGHIDIPSLESIFEAWKNSSFFNEERFALVKGKREFSKALYFNILKDRLDADLEEAAFALDSLVQIGRNNLGDFHDFMNKFDIAFSGPYRRSDSGYPRLVYFVSSINPTDSIVNNYYPLYGVYEFKLGSLNIPPEEALDYWEKLDVCPSWLIHYPPLFNLALDSMREQINQLS